MASVTSVTATPTTVTPHGGQATIVPTVVDPSQTFTGIVYDDAGGSASVTVTVEAENLTYSVDATKKGVTGYIVAVLSTGAPATIAVGADGASFVATAS
jgi:hypothetical protein